MAPLQYQRNDLIEMNEGTAFFLFLNTDLNMSVLLHKNYEFLKSSLKSVHIHYKEIDLLENRVLACMK